MKKYMRKSSEKRRRKRKDVTELNSHQISLLIEIFHDKIKFGPEYTVYACVVISYGIDHHLVYVVNLLITNVSKDIAENEIYMRKIVRKDT